MNTSELFRLERVTRTYAERTVLEIESLCVMQREVLALLGPSGSGKSTLLRILNLLEPPSSGRVIFDGDLVTGQPSLATRRAITMVFQRPLVLDTSVRGNVEYGLRLRGRRDDRAVDEALALVGLTALERARARTLSGGEMQRVALARALVIEPRVLLLDEPTANLDPANVAIIERAVHDLHHLHGTTIVLATHNIHQARRLADRAGLLLDGRIVEVATAQELFDAPCDARTRAFLSGEMVY